MATDEDFGWKFDRRFRLSDAIVLRVLQRDVANPSVFSADLLPFREEESEWIGRTAAEGTRISGRLENFRHAEQMDYYEIRQATGLYTCLTVANVYHRQLTVWRVHDKLDMLQIRANGDQSAIYGRVGGRQILGAFSRMWIQDPSNSTLRQVLDFYQSGQAPRR